MNPVNAPIFCSFSETSFPFLILSRAWVTNIISVVQVVHVSVVHEILIGSNDGGSPRTADWQENIWFSTVTICFNFSLTFTTALWGSLKTFLIYFLDCTNIILVLCEVVSPVKPWSLNSSFSIMTVQALPSAISGGHTSCLSNSPSAQHSCKYNTLWYGVPMPKSEATFISFLLLVNPCNSKERPDLSWLLSFVTKVWIHSPKRYISASFLLPSFVFVKLWRNLIIPDFDLFSLHKVWWTRHVISRILFNINLEPVACNRENVFISYFWAI